MENLKKELTEFLEKKIKQQDIRCYKNSWEIAEEFVREQAKNLQKAHVSGNEEFLPDDKEIEKESINNVLLNRYDINSRTGKAERRGFIIGAQWMRDEIINKSEGKNSEVAVAFADFIVKLDMVWDDATRKWEHITGEEDLPKFTTHELYEMFLEDKAKATDR